MQTIRQQWIGVIGVVIGLTGVATAATGQPAVLGRLNQADRPTVFENTGDGPAAAFKAASNRPPFTVGSGVQVLNLNATRLQGKLPSAFAPAGSTYTKAESDARYAPENRLVLDSAVLTGNMNVQPGTETDIYAVFVEPPATGTLTLHVFGHCQMGAAGGQLAIRLGTAPPATRSFVGLGGLCEVIQSTPVTRGFSLMVSARIENDSPTHVFTMFGPAYMLTLDPE